MQTSSFDIILPKSQNMFWADFGPKCNTHAHTHYNISTCYVCTHTDTHAHLCMYTHTHTHTQSQTIPVYQWESPRARLQCSSLYLPLWSASCFHHAAFQPDQVQEKFLQIVSLEYESLPDWHSDTPTAEACGSNSECNLGPLDSAGMNRAL